MFYRLFFMDRKDRYAKLLPSGASTHLDTASPGIRYSEEPIRIYCASGCMMSYNRKVLNEYTFDESYDGYSHGEDVDFSHRVSKKYKIYFTPHAKVYHNQPMSKKVWYGTEDFGKSKIHAQMNLFRKHRASNPLNYLALLWFWLGILIWFGLIDRNKIALRGALGGIRNELLRAGKD